MKYSTVIDIGSSKVMCITVSPNADGAITVEGEGTCEYRGYRLGCLPSVGLLSAAAESAVRQAQDESGVRVRSACIGVPAPFTKTVINSLEIPVTSKNSVISHADIDFLMDSAADFVPPGGYKLMHSTPMAFLSDGTPIDGSPIGKKAEKLGAKISHSFVSEEFRMIVVKSLKQLGIKAEPFIFTAMAESLFMIPYRERKNGVILIDCGGSHCDVLNIVDDAVASVESIGMGGLHITSDIALGLRIPLSAAETLKRNFKFDYDYGNSVERINIPREGIAAIENSTVRMIVEARAEEICETLSEAINRIEQKYADPVPVYMTGCGIALMKGGTKYLSRLIARPVICDVSNNERRELLYLASALGLAQFMLFGDGAALLSNRNNFLQNVKEFFIS